MVANFINGSADYTLDDLQGMKELDKDMQTIPVVSLAQYISAAAAEYRRLPKHFKKAYDARSKMLNKRPVPGVLTTIPDHIFPRSIKTKDHEGLILRCFAVDYSRFANKLQSFVRHKARGWLVPSRQHKSNLNPRHTTYKVLFVWTGKTNWTIETNLSD